MSKTKLGTCVVVFVLGTFVMLLNRLGDSETDYSLIGRVCVLAEILLALFWNHSRVPPKSYCATYFEYQARTREAGRQMRFKMELSQKGAHIMRVEPRKLA